MAKLKVSLGVGLSGCRQNDIIDIDDDEIADCETQDELMELIDSYAEQWAQNYIDIGAELIEEDE